MARDVVGDLETTECGGDSLLRLVYVSLATRPLSSADLDRLSRRSGQRNAAADITGLLMAQEPFFYGLMEGPRARLLAQMEVVISDSLHCCVRVLSEEPLRARRFLGWRVLQLPALNLPETGPASSVDFILDLARRLSEQSCARSD